jgi:hypothetical protein
MPAAGQTYVEFNDQFFDEIMKSAGVKQLTRQAAERVLAAAVSEAPVDTGAYRDGLGIEEVEHAHRTTVMVVGHDPKTMLIESKTQNLLKALRKAKA